MTEHKPDAKLISTYYNFSPVLNLIDGDGENLCEPFFSSFACETCGSELAGNRYYCTATIGKLHTNPREKLEICVDCFEYFFT